jgi:hypothetical protein
VLFSAYLAADPAERTRRLPASQENGPIKSTVACGPLTIVYGGEVTLDTGDQLFSFSIVSSAMLAILA